VHGVGSSPSSMMRSGAVGVSGRRPFTLPQIPKPSHAPFLLGVRLDEKMMEHESAVLGVALGQRANIHMNLKGERNHVRAAYSMDDSFYNNVYPCSLEDGIMTASGFVFETFSFVSNRCGPSSWWLVTIILHVRDLRATEFSPVLVLSDVTCSSDFANASHRGCNEPVAHEWRNGFAPFCLRR